jgi:hypothetical protein
MRKFTLASISILLFCICSFGQSKEISPCPSGLSVTGPSGLVSPGESIVFTSNVDNPENYPVIYKWSISNGEITKGQGTSSITVVKPITGESVTATLEISDLSGYCPTLSASETMITDCGDILSSLVDEISSFGSKKLDQDLKDRLDNYALTLLNNPNATGYILGYFSRNESESSMKTQLNKITDYLIKVRKFDASRITIAISESNDGNALIQFWIVPAGASPPTP